MESRNDRSGSASSCVVGRSWFRRAAVGWSAVLLLCACGGTLGGDGGDATGGDGRDGRDGTVVPCDFDPLCGGVCATDDDCGANLYCAGDWRCRADCLPGGSECGAGWTCEHGRCVEECPSIVVDLTPVTPTVMLLIDQSGSMDQDFGRLQRWSAVDTALTDPGTGVLPALESEVEFGAALYTSHNGSLGGEACPLLQTVGPALGNAGAIGRLLADNGPDGDTPTGEAITAVVAELTATPPAPGAGPRIIVLATDGEPDTCEVPNPQEGQDEAVQAAIDAYTAGVRTFILSVGSGVGAAHLQDMANAGAGLPVGGGTDAPYYVANNPEELTDAFRTIVGGVRSCTLRLDGEVAPEDRAGGDVRLDGVPVPNDATNGWTMTDGSTLELRGDACRSFLGAGAPVLTAEWPCGTIIG